MEFLHYWLVDHPIIRQYEWRQGHTIGSTPLFLILTVLTYLTLTLTFTKFPTLHPTINPSLLRLISSLHNLTLSLLSLLMSLGCTLSSLHQKNNLSEGSISDLSFINETPASANHQVCMGMGHNLSWIICFPANHTPPRGPTFFWAHVFYFSKILEFFDTYLIILSGSRTRRLSFLHVYHHAVVVVMCYLWLSTSQTLLPVALVTNATVHVVMYAYYFLSGLGFRPRWKRLVTDFQIIQFVFSFFISGLMLYFHFSGSGCSGIWGWCFNALFNASLLALFMDFHAKNYAAKRRGNVEKNK